MNTPHVSSSVRPAVSPITRLFLLAGLLTIAGLPALPAQNLVLGVDFDAVGSSTSPTQSGFQSFGISESAVAGPLQQSFAGLSTADTQTGTLTITLAHGSSITASGGIAATDRQTPSDNGSFTNGFLYRDLAFGQTNGAQFWVKIAGLNATTSYSVTFYSFEPADFFTTTSTFINETTGANHTPVSVTATSPITSNGGTVTFTAITDSSGNLLFSETSSRLDNNGNPFNDQPLLNGFQISAIPEPSTYTVLAGLSVLGFMAYRRRNV
jgi:hypothetical protein